MQTNQHHAKCTSNRCYLIIFVTCTAKMKYLLLAQPKWVLENRKGLEIGRRITKETERHSERSEKMNQNTVFSIAQTYAQFKLKTSKNHNGIINKKLSESKSTNLKGKTHLKFWPLWYGWRTSVCPSAYERVVAETGVSVHLFPYSSAVTLQFFFFSYSLCVHFFSNHKQISM